jgi:hypothetical protein
MVGKWCLGEEGNHLGQAGSHRRRVERPNLRWMDRVMRNAERLGVRNWRIKDKDRDGWKRLLESAKTLHGL